MDSSELLTLPLAFQNGSARLLTGDLVVRDIECWCHRNAEKGGIKPVMAVVYFNTGSDSIDYVKIKAHVAARVSQWYLHTRQERLEDDDCGIRYSPASALQSLTNSLRNRLASATGYMRCQSTQPQYKS